MLVLLGRAGVAGEAGRAGGPGADRLHPRVRRARHRRGPDADPGQLRADLVATLGWLLAGCAAAHVSISRCSSTV